MGILQRLKKAVKAAAGEIVKADSFSKGEDFEAYVEEQLLPSTDYELIYRTSSYSENKKNFASATMKPDFLYRCRKTNRRFYVEAKFRKDRYRRDDKLEWTNLDQLARYKRVDNEEHPVFVVLGIGDNGRKPEFVFVIPMNKLDYTGLYNSFLEKYEFYIDKPIFSTFLWKLREGR